MRKLQAIGKAVRYRDTGKLVARCEDTGPEHVRDDSGVACARLFAASPDLLDIARRTAAHFEGTDAPLGIAAREAIRKATRQ